MTSTTQQHRCTSAGGYIIRCSCGAVFQTEGMLSKQVDAFVQHVLSAQRERLEQLAAKWREIYYNQCEDYRQTADEALAHCANELDALIAETEQ